LSDDWHARGNHCACLVEAVGIEEVAVHPVSRIDGGISRTNAGDQPVESREEAAARRAFGTDDPKIVTRDELLSVLADAQSNGGKLADLARIIEALITVVQPSITSSGE